MRRLFLPLAVTILLVGAFLRLWQLDRFPPGPHYDEAVELIITRTIAFGGARPFPIVEAFQGREVLYYYLNAPLLTFFGDSIYTLHLSSALMGILTVAVSMALGRAMFRGRRGLIVGLAVGLMMTLSFPQIWLSRQAFRTSVQPLLQALALWCLWRGLNARQARSWLPWLILGGLFAGLSVYTYMASRLFPFWLLIGGLLLLILDRRRGLRARQGLVFFSVLGAVALPMALYAIEKPDIFFGRLQEVTTYGSHAITLGESVVKHLKLFFLEGDPYLRYNIPGRPYLTLPEGALLLIGLAVALSHLLRRGRSTERVAYGLALLAPLMVIPSVISVGGFPPSNMRSVGMIPLIYVLVAVGFESIWSRLAAGRSSTGIVSQRGMVFAALTLGLLAVGGVAVGEAYFGWAARADVFYESDGDLAAAAVWLPAHTDARTRVYVAARDRFSPTVAITNPLSVIWLGTDSLFRPSPGAQGIYVFPRSAPPPRDWAAWLEQGRMADVPLGPDGKPAFDAFRLDGSTPLPESAALPDAPVANGLLTLVGVQPPVVASGGHDQIITEWRVDHPPSFSDLTPIVQLEDARGDVLDRREVYMTQTDEWQTGEVLIQRLALDIPVGTPPGKYPVQVAWIAKSTNTYVPYANGQVWAHVGQANVIRPSSYPDPKVLPIAVRQPHDLVAGVRLLGWNPAQMAARPGEPLIATLFWQATEAIARTPLALSAVLRGDSGETVLWSGNMDYPPERWKNGELVTDHVVWPIPRDQAAGRYTLALKAGEQTVALGAVEIAGLARVFDPPAVQVKVGATFADSLGLYGYSSTTEAGQLGLYLVWNAQNAVSSDYTVFVHVVDASGDIVAQSDLMPQSGTYPTSLWLPGEFVEDNYRFSLKPGVYTIDVGLYSQATGARLNAKIGTKVLQDNSVPLSQFRVS